MRPSAPEPPPERASGRCLWRGRRGQSQPQREWPPRPPVPPTPDVPITARLARAHSAAIIATEGSAITQGTLTRRMSAVASSRPHPMASRRRLFAVGQPSVDGVRPRRRDRCVRFAFLVRSSSAYLGSLSRATTLLMPCSRAKSRAVLPFLVRSVGFAPRSRRRLAIVR